MTDTKCWNCEETLTEENRSEEHFILDSIGGKGAKSKNLLCESCNTEDLKALDDALSKQLGNLAALLGIDRDRSNKEKKTIVSVTKSGQKHFLGPKMKPKVVIDILDKETGKLITQAFGDSDKEAEKMALSMLTGKRTTPEQKERRKKELETIEYSAKKVEERVYLPNSDHSDPTIQRWGGLLVEKSMVKSSVNFARLNGVPISTLSYPIKFIHNKDGRVFRIARFYYPDQPFLDVKEREVFHSIQLIGDKEQGLLYCYIELFSFQKWLVMLNDSYTGEDLEASFSRDIISGEKITKSPNFKFVRHKALRYFDTPKQKEFEQILKQNQTKIDHWNLRLTKIIEDFQLEE